MDKEGKQLKQYNRQKYGKQAFNKKGLFFCVCVMLIVIVTAAALCFVFIPDWTSDEEYAMQIVASLSFDRYEVPIKIINNIEISTGDQTVAKYLNELTVKDRLNCSFTFNEEMYIGWTNDYNQKEEYYLIDDTIFMKRSDAGGEVVADYKGNYDMVCEIAYGELTDTSVFKLNLENSSSWSIEKDNETVTMSMKIAEEHKYDFFSEDFGEQIENVFCSVKMNKETKKLVEFLVEYDSTSNEEIYKTRISINVNYDVEITVPDWVK